MRGQNTSHAEDHSQNGVVSGKQDGALGSATFSGCQRNVRGTRLRITRVEPTLAFSRKTFVSEIDKIETSSRLTV